MPRDENPSEVAAPLTIEHIEALARIFKENTSGGGSEMLAAIAAMTEMVKGYQSATSSLSDNVKRTVVLENRQHENESVFNYKAGCAFCESRTRHPEDANDPESGRLGHPKPQLAFDTFFPAEARVVRDDATVMEVELLNALGSKLKTVPFNRVKIRQNRWQAWLSDEHSRLFLDAPHFTSDERNSLPPLPQIIMEFLHGKAEDPAQAIMDNVALKMRLAELQAQIDALKAPASVSA